MATCTRKGKSKSPSKARAKKGTKKSHAKKTNKSPTKMAIVQDAENIESSRRNISDIGRSQADSQLSDESPTLPSEYADVEGLNEEDGKPLQSEEEEQPEPTTGHNNQHPVTGASSYCQDEADQTRKRKGRGRTVNHGLTRDSTLRVLQWDERDKVIGQHAAQLASFCGQLIRSRHLTPLQLKGWYEIPKEKINQFLNRIADYFVVSTPETPVDMRHPRVHYLTQKLSHLYREYRGELHGVYKARHTKPEKVKKVLNEAVSKDDWNYLVAY